MKKKDKKKGTKRVKRGAPRGKRSGQPVIAIVPSKLWDEEWVARVETAAIKAGRAICGARTKRKGTPCLKPPAPGGGRCRLHGGHAGRPPTNFLYTRVARQAATVISRAEEMLNDPDLLDMRQEVAALKALLSATMDRVDAAYERLKKYEDNYWTLVEKQKGLTKTITVNDGDKSYEKVVESDESKRHNMLLMAFLAEQSRAVAFAREVVKALEKLGKLEVAREYVTTADRMAAVVKAYVSALFAAVADEVADAERLARIEKSYRSRVAAALGQGAVLELKAPEEEGEKADGEMKH